MDLSTLIKPAMEMLLKLWPKRTPVVKPSPLRLLIVEDDPDYSKFVSLKLKSAGYTCDTAHNADSALQLLREKHHKLVFADVGLKGRDGWSLAREIKDDPSLADTRVWIMTGGEVRIVIGSRTIYLEPGYAVGFVGKSVRFEALEDAIRMSGL